MKRGLLALDIDGVLTDGIVSVDASGDERKLLSYRDIDAVFEARREGLLVALLTAEATPIAERIAGRLEVDRFIPNCRDKASELEALAEDLGVPLSNVCFIGDSRKDAGALEVAGLGLVPADAEAAARFAADVVLSRPGGAGAVAEGLSLFLDHLAGAPEAVTTETSAGEPALEHLQKALRELGLLLDELEKTGLDEIVAAGELLRRTLAVGGTILTFGNGGSAADAQHLAAEISGFYRGASGAGRAIALTADSALLTALANDAGYQEAIALQVGLHARAGDAVVAFSTSGRSENIVRGLTVAREKGLPTILVTGAAAPAEVVADVRVAVPSTDTQRIQEAHGVVVHLLCELARGEG